MDRILNTLVPYRVSPEHEQFYSTTQRVYYFGLLAHAFGGIIFYAINVMPMAWFALIISCPFFLTAIILNRLEKLNLAFAIAFLELYFHQVIAVYFLGWNLGFQYWLIYLVDLGFLNPTWGKKVQILQITLFVLAFVVLSLFFPEGVYKFPGWITTSFYLFNSICAIVALSLLINGYSRSAHLAGNQLRELNRELQISQSESRSLLLNILPESIADRLTKDRNLIADAVNNATIIFCDLVGFTEMSSGMNAEQVVTILDGVFSGFDSIVENVGLEKIKTIGDGYMAAAGIPNERKDHALAAIICAAEMQRFVREYNDQLGLEIKLRIGVNSGPVVAGVIGKNKFAYDLWGDTVNTASRMESHGVVDKIQITEATYLLVKDYCTAQKREAIHVKGKGMMETYFVEEVQPEVAGGIEPERK